MVAYHPGHRRRNGENWTKGFYISDITCQSKNITRCNLTLKAHKHKLHVFRTQELQNLQQCSRNAFCFFSRTLYQYMNIRTLISIIQRRGSIEARVWMFRETLPREVILIAGASIRSRNVAKLNRCQLGAYSHFTDSYFILWQGVVSHYVSWQALRVCRL